MALIQFSIRPSMMARQELLRQMRYSPSTESVAPHTEHVVGGTAAGPFFSTTSST
jgi:hypothetical protein